MPSQSPHMPRIQTALSEQMQKSLGLKKDIVSIDFEEAVIKRMKNKGVAGVEYLVMDATAMSFDSGSFDYAIDKSTLDALCSDKSHEKFQVVTLHGLFD